MKSSRPFSSLPLRERLAVRHRLLEAMRAFFTGRGFVEVETPSLVACPGIDPHVDALEVPGEGFLITSPELHMKRLLAEGMPRIFQVTRAFRAGERGCLHRPEFTMLEWYRAGQDHRGLMEETEGLVRSAAAALADAGVEVRCGAWPEPFARLLVDQAFRGYAGWEPSSAWDEERFFRDLIDRVEPRLAELGAVFLHGFPAPVASLARLSPADPLVAERCELYLDGLEVCNGFSELTDAREQRERFERANRARMGMGKRPYPVDERFLDAMECGIPECAGNALGVDRLLMALTGARDIGGAISFPLG